MQSAIREQRDEHIDPQWGFVSNLTGYRLQCPVPAADGKQAAMLLANALAPSSAAVLQRELARLRAVTISRNTEATDLALAMAAYAEALREYPPDVVAGACRGRWKFWPALAELLDCADELVADRRAMLAAILDAPEL